MKYSQKYTLAAFLEPIKLGTEFSMADWPLHVTLADTFAIELNLALEQKLNKLLKRIPELNLSIGADATLGTTKAVLVNNTNALQSLHNQIIDLLESTAAKFNNPEFTRIGFLPHITNPESLKLSLGDTIQLNTISLIDMFPREDWQQRKVISSYKLR